MIRRFSIAAAYALMILLGMGCDLFGESDAPSTIAGTWRGTVTTQDSSYTLTLNLEQPPNANLRRSSVSGNGRLAAEKTAWDFSIGGTLTKPSLSLSLRFQRARPAQLEGEVDEALETIDAEIVGGPASFDGVSVTLERQ